MKKLTLQSILAACLLCLTAISTVAAQSPDIVALGEIAPYNIEVTYDKTSHIIFPAGIRYVDLGSENIVAGKANEADNVLRVKAAVEGFEQETNFSVITEDGRFYGFNVCYSDLPEVFGYNMVKGSRAAERSKSADIRFEELGTTPASLTGLVMETLYERDRRAVKNMRSQGYGITFSLKGLYIHNSKYYLHLELENESSIPFHTDFVKFSIVDRKVARRTVIQELELQPLRSYRPLLPVVAHSKEKNIFLLDAFTLAKGQVLEIEVVEKNGGRGQLLRLKPADLQKAQPLEKLRLKF